MGRNNLSKGSTLPESWFIERIGKEIMAASPAYNGPMTITDEKHASYLYNWAQKYGKYFFTDLQKPQEA